MAGCILLLRGLISAFILTLVLHQAELSVFLPASEANRVLVRWRRAGSYLLEEIFEGNLEKECYEEVCNYEEAREVFEDDIMTENFWKQYSDCPQEEHGVGVNRKRLESGSPCLSQPCLNNGICKDHIRNYSCMCSPGYEGKNCAMGTIQRPQPLQEMARDIDAMPVKLTNSKGKDFCGGVLIQEGFVLTTAKCSLLHNNISVKANAGQRIGVKSTHVHMRYDEESGENDLSLLELEKPLQCPSSGLPVCVPERDFAEHVLIPGTEGLLSGWMLNGTDLDTTPMMLPVTQVDGEECEQTLNVTVTTRTSCEESSVVTGSWVEGSVVTREHKGTWFLTGILDLPPPGQSPVLLLTTVPRYSMWFKQIMK
ncbi:hypothetical protein STEG23_002036 [Scotinomys teguina]